MGMGIEAWKHIQLNGPDGLDNSDKEEPDSAGQRGSKERRGDLIFSFPWLRRHGRELRGREGLHTATQAEI